ncbi:glyoxalase superfamily protein [Paenibacillus sp. E194]|uniref:glyoxalase superfamily protein n=1 Tax=Paenibacillus sp. E194 TaxID=1458845 RepID=UPI0005CB5658|nr:glyoxalase superfamily protein [Paenibacillus sp. E194]
MEDISFRPAIPILRIFDEHKAREFYVDFLGFRIEWEHRYGDNFPLYMQVARGNCILHLSEHHGDCCPGSAVRIEVSHIRQLHAEMRGKKYKYAKPGLDQDDHEVTVTDPFGNRIIFYEQVSS